MITCYSCQGRGWIRTNTCSDCGGSGCKVCDFYGRTVSTCGVCKGTGETA